MAPISTASGSPTGFSPVRSSTVRAFSSYLVTPKELSEALKKNPPSPISTDPRVIPLCAAWFMPNDGRSGIDVFLEQRIPKARFFDIDKVVERHSELPHMLPSPKELASTMSELGIRIDDTVVVYDSKELGIFSAPRVAWTLRAFGHPKVHILDNFKQYVEEGLPVESGEFYPVDVCTYPIPKLDEARIASFEDVKKVASENTAAGVSADGVQIIDARGPGRWSGKDAEPRAGLSSGHMPGSINIPFGDVLDPATKKFLAPEALRELFKAKGLSPDKPVIASCGSGVTACVLEAALKIAEFGSPETHRVYDGSWTEWAQRATAGEGLIVKTVEAEKKPVDP
ncbi:putative 3-mercaptopyruvate sulfurtransferase [Ceratocystis lukuohia]|uniref:3-mercaptopyruvate sulfurtransferase n=2 Tax=Ceratocystis TaxID=5157 RepID=A0ABR4ML35_9PEZI|nr:putative 3-mercaptopyruvate sulfurtransferase [Ceratocystis fimbriata CBS 114723]